jgi:hypothetical protein
VERGGNIEFSARSHAMSNTTMREALRESAAEAKSPAAGKSSSDATAVRDKPSDGQRSCSREVNGFPSPHPRLRGEDFDTVRAALVCVR